MPYLGRGLDKGNYLKLDDISSGFNGITTTFSLKAGGSAHYPGSGYSILVSLGGIIQEGESAYTINQDEITFASAPAAVDDCFIISLGVPIGIGVPGNATVSGTKLTKPFSYDSYFYLDSTNNQVGIGSLTPQYDLDIVTTDTSIARLRSSSSTGTQDSLLLQSNSATALRFQPNFQAANKYNWRVGAQTKIDNGFEITPSNNVGITNFDHPVIGIQTNQVGINTANPTEALHVFGNLNVTGIITGGDFSGIDSDKISEGNTAVETVDTGSNGHITFDTEGTERFRIGHAGVSTFLKELHVNAGTGATVFLNAGTHNASVAAVAMLKLGYKHSGGQGVGYLKLTEGGNNSFDGDLTFGVPYNKGSGNFGTRDSMTIKFNGNVGIGTDVPATKVHIHGGDETLLITGDTAVGSAANTGGIIALGGIYHTDGSITAWSQIKGLKDNSTSNNYAGHLLFTTRNQSAGYVERLRITSDGNVDINGNPPWTVTGGDWRNLSISGQTASSSGFIWLGNGAAATNADFDLGRVNFCNGATITSQIAGSTQTSNNDDGRITISTKATGGTLTERVRIDSNGVVGINTTSPGGNGIGLAVNSSNTNVLATGAVALNLKNTNPTDNTWVSMDFNNSVGGIVGRFGAQFKDTSDKDTDLYFATRADGGNLEEIVRITSTGNVGINETSPDNKLHVTTTNSNAYSFNTNNTQNITNALLKLQNLHGSDGSGVNNYVGIHFAVANGATSHAQLNYARTGDNAGAFQFKARNAGSTYPNLMTITSAGNVGVGTTVPGYKLHVHGSFAATTKSFVIPHPTKENYNLRYACLEGPENSVYVRGRTVESVIQLPDYWTGLVDEESITVNLTPIGNKKVWVEGINNNEVFIGSNDSIDCFYTVFGERTDVEKLEVEVEDN